MYILLVQILNFLPRASLAASQVEAALARTRSGKVRARVGTPRLESILY
jgi:hypothetical protein